MAPNGGDQDLKSATGSLRDNSSPLGLGVSGFSHDNREFVQRAQNPVVKPSDSQASPRPISGFTSLPAEAQVSSSREESELGNNPFRRQRPFSDIRNPPQLDISASQDRRLVTCRPESLNTESRPGHSLTPSSPPQSYQNLASPSVSIPTYHRVDFLADTHCRISPDTSINVSPPYPHTTVENVEKWKRTKAVGELPGRDRALRQLRNREQVFVIDDSENICRHYQSEVARTAKVLMHLVKDCDPNGIELRFTSNPGKAYKGTTFFGAKTKTKHLVDKIRTHLDTCDAGPCNMEQQLDVILKDVVRADRKTSITVFTDGVWERGTPADGGGVEDTLISVADRIHRWGMRRTDIAIQFVRFGDDELGIRRLTYLDDHLKDHPRMFGL